jgi:membrane protein DedA with SNARE-associated domain
MIFSLIAAIIDPIKLVIALIIFRKNPSWLMTMATAIAAGIAVAALGESLNVIPVFDLIVVPNVIASAILFALAKFFGAKRALRKSEEEN